MYKHHRSVGMKFGLYSFGKRWACIYNIYLELQTTIIFLMDVWWNNHFFMVEISFTIQLKQPFKKWLAAGYQVYIFKHDIFTPKKHQGKFAKGLVRPLNFVTPWSSSWSGAKGSRRSWRKILTHQNKGPFANIAYVSTMDHGDWLRGPLLWFWPRSIKATLHKVCKSLQYP